MSGAKNATSIVNVTPALFVENLRLRYQDAFKTNGNEKDCGIYTWVGTVLLALNPFARLRFYGDDLVDYHFRKTIAHADPHPFALASHAFCSLQKTKAPQSIIISGESGSGKTETSKIVLDFLTKIGGSTDFNSEHVICTGPILEAFGNAKTTRNDNSSRFGKTIRLFFDQDTQKKLIGSNIETYLLARSRVSHVPGGERNYHIFYLLTNGLSPDDPLREAVHLKGRSSQDFHYLTGSSVSSYMSDETFLSIVRGSFKDLGLDTDFEKQLFRLISAIGWLGNIDVIPDESNPANACCIAEESREALAKAADLMEIDLGELERSLTKQVICVGGKESVIVTLSCQKARMFRDSLARLTYCRVFDWLVFQLNLVLSKRHGSSTPRRDASRLSLSALTPPGGFKSTNVETEQLKPCISILDIFGYENMAKNGLEQLCINFANEKIHRFFLENVVLSEIDEYSRENIPYAPVSPADNSPVVEAIELGLLELLRRSTVDSMLRPLDNVDYDSEFCDKIPLAGVYIKRQHHSRNFPRIFSITHFAGDVIYDSEGFVESNKDSDQKVDILLSKSSSWILKGFAVPEVIGKRKTLEDEANQTGAASQQVSKRCIATAFARQVNSLLEELQLSRGHYIKCIKPNDACTPAMFDTSKISEQLRVTGMFEVLVLMSWAFPIRLSYIEIFDKFKPLINASVLSRVQSSGNISLIFCEELLKYLQAKGSSQSALNIVDGTDFALGISRLFFKHGKFEPLENLLSACDRESTTRLQVAEHMSRQLILRRKRRQIAFMRQIGRFAICLRKSRNFRKWFLYYFLRLVSLVKYVKRKLLPNLLSRRLKRMNAARLIQRKWKMSHSSMTIANISKIRAVCRANGSKRIFADLSTNFQRKLAVEDRHRAFQEVNFMQGLDMRLILLRTLKDRNILSSRCEEYQNQIHQHQFVADGLKSEIESVKQLQLIINGKDDKLQNLLAQNDLLSRETISLRKDNQNLESNWNQLRCELKEKENDFNHAKIIESDLRRDLLILEKDIEVKKNIYSANVAELNDKVSALLKIVAEESQHKLALEFSLTSTRIEVANSLSECLKWKDLHSQALLTVAERDAQKREILLEREKERHNLMMEVEDSRRSKLEIKLEMDRVLVERDRLAREVKRLKSSFVPYASTNESNEIMATPNVEDAKSRAVSDFFSADIDLRADQNRSGFNSRLGHRTGKVKFSDWMNRHK